MSFRGFPAAHTAFLQAAEEAALFRGGHGKRGNRPVHPRFPSEVALLQNICKQILHGEGSVLFHDAPEPQIPMAQEGDGFRQPHLPGFLQQRLQFFPLIRRKRVNVHHPVYDLPKSQTRPKMLVDMEYQNKPVEGRREYREPVSFDFMPFPRVNTGFKERHPLFIGFGNEGNASVQFKANSIFCIAIVVAGHVLFIGQGIAVCFQQRRGFFKISAPDQKIHIAHGAQGRVGIGHGRRRALEDHAGNVVCLQQLQKLILRVHHPRPLGLTQAAMLEPWRGVQVGREPLAGQGGHGLLLHLFIYGLPVGKRNILIRKQRSPENIKHICHIYTLPSSFLMTGKSPVLRAARTARRRQRTKRTRRG